MLNLRLIEAAVLIDISRLAELDSIRVADGALEIGAAVTQNKLLARPNLARDFPLLAAGLPFVGHFQTRNKGTVCGSIAHADPSSELPLLLAMYEGEVVLRSQRGSRAVAAKDFHQDMLTTAREADELIVAVRFPQPPKAHAAFREIARRHGDFAIIAVAASAAESGRVTLGVGGMAGRPMTRTIAARGAAATADAIKDWAEELQGCDDLHASAAMRRDMFRKLAINVVAEVRP
jgi:2-furoyl-CoA dehydrogenase FAD binding subunit